MRRRTANRIVKEVGFHSLKWEWQKTKKGRRLVGTAYCRHRWKFSTIAKAFDCRSIYPFAIKGCQIKLFERFKAIDSPPKQR